MIPPQPLLPSRSHVHPLTQGKDVTMDTGDMIWKSPALSLAHSRLSFPLISPSLPLLFLFFSLLLNRLFYTPVLALFLQLPVEVASLLSNSVRRLKGGNYIHAAWPLWTLSPLVPCLLTGNWFKGPHWHLRDGNRELWKCLRVFANVYVWMCGLMCKDSYKKQLRWHNDTSYTSIWFCLT